MFQLICTSYNKTEQGLVLRNNWIENNVTSDKLMELINKWELPDDFQYPSKGSISNVLCGKMDIDNVICVNKM